MSDLKINRCIKCNSTDISHDITNNKYYCNHCRTVSSDINTINGEELLQPYKMPDEVKEKLEKFKEAENIQEDKIVPHI
jgi:hypothetical protein